MEGVNNYRVRKLFSQMQPILLKEGIEKKRTFHWITGTCKRMNLRGLKKFIIAYNCMVDYKKFLQTFCLHMPSVST